MDIEILHQYCLGKPGVTESFPFGEDTLVLKVMNKMFLLLDLSGSETMNVKCDPERALELREEFEEVQPGYHMNKTHWNTVFLKGRLTDQHIKAMIDHSYQLVVAGLPKSQQALLKGA